MLNLRLLAPPALAIALAACASSEPTATVSNDVSPTASFAGYRTYSWISSAVPAGLDPVIGERIRDTVDSAMAAKGYAKVDPPNGDLSVAYTVGAKDKTDIASYSYFGDDLNVRHYTEGHLAVDAFDTKTRKAVWHGAATQRIDPKGDPARVNGVVAQVMQSFPTNPASAPAAG